MTKRAFSRQFSNLKNSVSSGRFTCYLELRGRVGCSYRGSDDDSQVISEIVTYLQGQNVQEANSFTVIGDKVCWRVEGVVDHTATCSSNDLELKVKNH